jgi:hypothetical protein
MITILADHNIEGHAVTLLGILAKAGWLDLVPLRMVTFADVGLAYTSSDRQVWRFAQANAMLLLTDNRNMKDEDSLEQTIRDENTATSLPVLTIGNINRLDELTYRERCAERLLEIGVEIERYLGMGRIFIP